MAVTSYPNDSRLPTERPHLKPAIGCWAAILGISILLALYTLIIEPAWVTITHLPVKVGVTGTPITLAQLSDLHLNSMDRTRRAVINIVRQSPPDLLLLTGDVIDSAKSLPALDTFLGMLPQTSIKIAVLGNWEYWSGVDLRALEALYAKHNVTLLVNRTLHVRNITIIGLDDFTAGKPDFEAAAQARISTSPTIVLQHSPGFFSSTHHTAHRDIALSLSGHTHGGQIALFGKTLFTPQGSGEYTAGWYDTDWGRLFVSKGIGTSIMPVRFGARPEVVFFHLQ